MKKKQRCFFKRFVALVAAMVISFSLAVPAFAANNWPASPSAADFNSHRNCWYVWQRKTLSGYSGYELICLPMFEWESTNTTTLSLAPYSTDSSTYSYTKSSGVTRILMYSYPYIPFSYFSGSWSDLPSFPVGDPSPFSAAVRIYPDTASDSLSSIPDVFSDRSIYGFLTSWPSSGSSSFADQYDHEILDYLPVYVPSNIFFFGDRTISSSNVTSFGIVHGSNDFWATPSNSKYLGLTSSHYGVFHSFPANFSIPSSELGFVFCKRPSGSGVITSNDLFNVSINFAASLWVPDGLLPSDVKVGDWISKATVEDLQDELAKEFDVNSDTLKNSKDNLNSWKSTSSVDSDVASGATGLLNGIFQNLGTFLFSVSLLCFGAVVLRMLIRKAVDG